MQTTFLLAGPNYGISSFFDDASEIFKLVSNSGRRRRHISMEIIAIAYSRRKNDSY